jgi:hypothetical protein
MTYAEKLLQNEKATHLDYDPWFHHEEVQRLINQAMQAQREADAEAARIVVLSHSSLGVVKKVQEAILNAEVKI